MLQVKPFKGLRPVPEMAKEVASPPYDVLSSNEAREKAKDHPHSFLHVIKPEIDLDPAIDIHDPKVYEQGATALKQMIRGDMLFQDNQPCYYIYKLRMGTHEQVGLVAVASVEDYLQGRIKKHEHTRPDKETDRTNHIDHLNAQTGPVFLLHRHNREIAALLDKGMESPPVYDIEGDYGIQHTVYVVDDSGLINKIQDQFAKLDALYIADGHHRSAAASRVYQKRKKENPHHTGSEPYNYYLTVIFPDTQMQILDYNRVVKDLNGLSKNEFFKKMETCFSIQTCQGTCKPVKMHTFGLYLEGEWVLLEAKESTFDPKDPISVLDISILQDNVLSPILGIQDPRTDDRINFVGGIRGLTELEKLVDQGDYKLALSNQHRTTHGSG
jgi:uncharacterized protein (DUF1015 family)